MAERLPISTAHCTVERDGHVVTVTMRRPEARNALSTDMLVGMADAWAYITATDDVRVGILTGADGTLLRGRRPQGDGPPVGGPAGTAAGRRDHRLPLEGPAPRQRCRPSR